MCFRKRRRDSVIRGIQMNLSSGKEGTVTGNELWRPERGAGASPVVRFNRGSAIKRNNEPMGVVSCGQKGVARLSD